MLLQLAHATERARARGAGERGNGGTVERGRRGGVTGVDRGTAAKGEIVRRKNKRPEDDARARYRMRRPGLGDIRVPYSSLSLSLTLYLPPSLLSLGESGCGGEGGGGDRKREFCERMQG
jgi:hypothetical protein